MILEGFIARSEDYRIVIVRPVNMKYWERNSAGQQYGWRLDSIWFDDAAAKARLAYVEGEEW